MPLCVSFFGGWGEEAGVVLAREIPCIFASLLPHKGGGIYFLAVPKVRLYLESKVGLRSFNALDIRGQRSKKTKPTF